MQNSQFSDPTVAKLLEVDADLAATEVELTRQLQSIQDKRYSLKNVIGLFAPDATASTLAPIPTPVIEQQAEPPAQEVVTLQLDEVTPDPTEAAPPQQKRPIKNTLSTNDKPRKKSSLTKEVSKEADTWPQYLREEFANASLSVAVSEVMQQHPDQILEITAIINAIFVDEIPKQVRSTARERVSNILSVGAKKGKWDRGVAGKYSMSRAALEGNS